MNIKSWPSHDRPREKLIQQGPQALTDIELLAIFLRTGRQGQSVIELANALLGRFGSLRQLLKADKGTLCSQKGMGPVKFAQLQAALEMARRCFSESMSRDTVFENPEHTRSFLLGHMRDEAQEIFSIIFLDSQHRMIKFSKLFYGTINAAKVYPRVIVKQVLDANAAAVILAHNHPSGVAEPSEADRQITQLIQSALKLIDVTVLDHFVIGDGYHVSFAERGLL